VAVEIPFGVKMEKMDFQERVRRRNEFDASIVYGTRQFNLLTRRQEHMAFREDNDDLWIDKKSGRIFEKFSEKRNCPLCSSADHTVIFVKSGFPHVKCNNCSLVYVNPILNRAEYEKLWSSEDSWENVLESEHQIKMQALEAAYSLDIAGLYFAGEKKADICDVGCGPGTLLSEAKKRGHRVFGIEPNRRCHGILKDKGIAFTEDFFPLKKDLGMKFDCIFLLNTLEHLRDPLLIVREAGKLLKERGVIYVSLPCIDALVNRVMHEKAGVFGGHSHIQFFSILTLSELFRKAGLKVLEYETIITEIGVIKNYLSFLDPYFGENPDNLDFITPELIYRNHLARNLNMVGRIG
jgi:SAM-dependent methyltransferase